MDNTKGWQRSGVARTQENQSQYHSFTQNCKSSLYEPIITLFSNYQLYETLHRDDCNNSVYNHPNLEAAQSTAISEWRTNMPVGGKTEKAYYMHTATERRHSGDTAHCGTPTQWLSGNDKTMKVLRKKTKQPEAVRDSREGKHRGHRRWNDLTPA